MARTPDQLGVTAPALAAELLGDLPHPGGPLRLEPFPYAFGSPATGGLYRLSGPGWSWFGKLLQHVRHWPVLGAMPPAQAAHFVAHFPWRSELELWDERFVSRFPAGLRAPVLHGLVELPEDRVVVWMEDVAEASPARDLDQLALAALLLGRWNARCADPSLVAGYGRPVGYALRMYAEQAVATRGLALLEDDALWAHPWLRGHGDLREELRRLGAQIPDLLDRLDRHVQTIPHGDASPQNLLVPADGDPAELVVIDVSFRSAHALGFDLGQLMVGLVHADVLPASRLPRIAAAIVPAYVAGLAEEGVDEDQDVVRAAFATSVLLRSGFDGFLYGELASADASSPPSDTFMQRLEMSRFLLEQYDDARRL